MAVRITKLDQPRRTHTNFNCENRLHSFRASPPLRGTLRAFRGVRSQLVLTLHKKGTDPLPDQQSKPQTTTGPGAVLFFCAKATHTGINTGGRVMSLPIHWESWLRSRFGKAGLLGLAAAVSFAGIEQARWSLAATSGSAMSGPGPAAVASAADLSKAFRYASEKVMPAVVTVHSTSRQPQQVSAKEPNELSPGSPERPAAAIEEILR